jgi:Tol biopolymer transport system component
VLKRLRFLLALALVAIAALSLGASAASAAPKEIAFECGFDICLLDPNNPSDVFNLTDNGATSYDEDPVWSPDGKRVAFVAKFATTFPQQVQIYTMEPEAPGQTFNGAVQITHFPTGLESTDEIAWSPDGTKLAFVRGNLTYGSNTLYVVNADGSSANATAIPTVGGAAHPTFSADSGKIAFADSAKRIYTVNSDISSPATLLPGATGREPVWSPDGSKIAYGREFIDMNIIAAGGGSPLAIPFNSNFAFASWSPSGAQLAYYEQTGGSANFRVVNADGSGNHPIPIVAGTAVSGGPASWSPDASRMVFEGAFLNDPMTSADDVHNVYIANADGSGVATALSPGEPYNTEPAWKPNPIAHPGPAVITPSGGSSDPLQGPTIKPQLKWFTNRIPWNEAPYVPMLSVACGGPVCNAGGTGTSKASVAAGIRPRPALAAASSARPKGSKKKPKTIVVAKGKVHVPSGQTRILKLKLTKLAIAILEKVGKLKMSVTVTTTIAGQAPFKETRSIEVVAKQKPTGKH